MLDALIAKKKKKTDAVAAIYLVLNRGHTRSRTATIIIIGRDPVRMGQQPTIEEKLVAHDHRVRD